MEQVREVEDVADLLQQRGGLVDALAQLAALPAAIALAQAAIAIVHGSPAAFAQESASSASADATSRRPSWLVNAAR